MGAVIGVAPQDTEQIAAAVTRLLPEALVPVFGASFTRSHMLFDQYVLALVLQVFAATDLEAALGDWASAEEAVARRGLDPRAGMVAVDWMLRHLAARGVLARDERGRFRAEDALPACDPAAIVAEQRRHDATCLPSYALAETVARDYPAFLRGERAGEDILFAPTRLPLWVGYFSNDNILYAVNNRVGAVALEAWMPPHPAILELGGGLGSGASAALDRLAGGGRLGDVAAYRFTELVPAFLRRGERLLRQQFPDAAFLACAPLDMNRPFGEQGVAPASVSLVYAVNTLHVAHDLAFTLSEIRRALTPGGQVIVSECVRPSPGHTAYPEFVFNLLHTFRAPRLDDRYRPNGGFLTPEQWTAAFTAAGLDDVRVLPDIARIREVFPHFYVAAIGAARPD